MKRKSRAFSVAVISALVAILLSNGAYRIEPVASVVRTSQLKTCPSKTELELAVQDFSASKTFHEMEAAKLRLLNGARLSPKCRGQVIGAIIAAMDKPQLDVYRDFALWRYGSHLLGELEATEGLDLLIRNLSFTDGGSINVTHYPAMEGVIKIGHPAVHRLGAALRQNSDVHYRYNAVFCIAQIGGPDATKELSAALPSESDSCVRKFIQISIKALSNPKSPNQIAFEDRDAWFAARSCKE